MEQNPQDLDSKARAKAIDKKLYRSKLSAQSNILSSF